MSNVILIPPPSGISSIQLRGISSDSRIVCGYSTYTTGENIAFKFYGSDEPVIEELGTLPGFVNSIAFQCSDEIIVGHCANLVSQTPFIYTPENLIQELPQSGSTSASASCISPDGVVIGSSSNGVNPTIWVNGVLENLNNYLGTPAFVSGCSNSFQNQRQYLCGGTIAVNSQALLWIPGNNTPQILPPLPGDVSANASGISGDGRFVVGSSNDGITPLKPVYWDTQENTVNEIIMPAAIVNDSYCTAISEDGKFVVGLFDDGNRNPFIFVIPTGNLYDLDPDDVAGNSIPYSVSNSGIAVGHNNSNGVIYGRYKLDVKYVPTPNSITLPCYTPCLAVGGIFTKV